MSIVTYSKMAKGDWRGCVAPASTCGACKTKVRISQMYYAHAVIEGKKEKVGPFCCLCFLFGEFRKVIREVFGDEEESEGE